MRQISYLIIIFFLMTLVSCDLPTSNKIFKSVHFHWKIAGILPETSLGKPSIGLAGPIVGINNDVLIIGGGANFPDGMPWNGGKKVYHHDVYVFKSGKDSLTNMQQDVQLPYDIAYSANCSNDRGIIAAGGENENGPLNKVLLIHWDSAIQKIIISDLPDLPQPLTDGAMAADGSKVFFAGGISPDSVSNRFYVLDLKDTAAGWQVLPLLPKPVSHSVLYVQNDGKDTCIYLVGGRKEIKDSTSDLYNEVYQFNLKTKEWSLKTPLPHALSAQTGLAWGDSSLLVFSGDEGKAFHASEGLSMKIAKEKNPSKKKLLIEEKIELQKNHPGYNGNVLLYNTRANKWMKIDSIPFPGQVTTTAIKWGDKVMIPCGEIRAGVRTPDIIMGELK